jgi:hypothetical protein
LHRSLSAKFGFYLPAFEISGSCRTISLGGGGVGGGGSDWRNVMAWLVVGGWQGVREWLGGGEWLRGEGMAGVGEMAGGVYWLADRVDGSGRRRYGWVSVLLQ